MKSSGNMANSVELGTSNAMVNLVDISEDDEPDKKSRVNRSQGRYLMRKQFIK